MVLTVNGERAHTTTHNHTTVSNTIESYVFVVPRMIIAVCTTVIGVTFQFGALVVLAIRLLATACPQIIPILLLPKTPVAQNIVVCVRE